MTLSTTLKLPEALKARITPLAHACGKTAHAWMIEALEAQAELAERRRGFLEDALASAKEVEGGGVLYAMEDVHAYIAERAAGRKAPHPKPVAGQTGKSRAPSQRRR
jgi:predicted transcriptional regulator